VQTSLVGKVRRREYAWHTLRLLLLPRSSGRNSTSPLFLMGHFHRRRLSCRWGGSKGTNLLGCGSSCALLDLQLDHRDAGRWSRRTRSWCLSAGPVRKQAARVSQRPEHC